MWAGLKRADGPVHAPPMVRPPMVLPLVCWQAFAVLVKGLQDKDPMIGGGESKFANTAKKGGGCSVM
jgi:hypothetical protein